MRVDVVYTWVNHDDPEWLKLYAGTVSGLKHDADSHQSSNNIARFQNREELLYSIRSVRKFAPWVGNIFVVTNCRLPEALEERQDVLRVSHEEIFPDRRDLPAFNSVAIETNLHRIDGLSERFIYFNDDVFLCDSVSESDFFTGEGKTYLFPCGVDIPYTRKGVMRPSEHHAINAGNLLYADFGYRPEKKLHHTPFPLLRSTLYEIEERYPEQIALTRTHKFRDNDDLPVATTLHAYYALVNGYGEIGDIRARYVDIGDPLFLLLVNRFSPLRRGKYVTYCLNEVTGLKYFTGARDAIVKRLMEKMLDE